MEREVRDPETRQGSGVEPGRSDGRYACQMCDQAFRFQHELDKHEREEHPPDAPPDAPIGQL